MALTPAQQDNRTKALAMADSVSESEATVADWRTRVFIALVYATVYLADVTADNK